MHYTQDESYYLLDAKPDSCVYLGTRNGIDPQAMLAELAAAQRGEKPFDDERFINRFPARKHDHFLIPAGTVHCSGEGAMVLEISATPYIFTFKLWDWGRVGLDGIPRPIHLEHGSKVIQWDRDTDWSERNLVNCIEPIAEGEGWREERTGLHEREFIETRRHWFSVPVEHDTGGTVQVLNLIEGREATVDSPDNAFAPFVVHYAETFIVPASVGRYRIRPSGESEGQTIATIKAYVRGVTKMLRILIATHGSLAPALLASANMVYGELPAVATVSLTEEGGIEAFRAEFEQTLRRHGAGADGVLVLCDMECGTPLQRGMPLCI